ncbi:MAG: molybdopterin-dependent oxidoreductase, partial [Pseudomonadota bacterium]
MNKPVTISTGFSACPHDCPSTCALDVEIVEDGTIGRLRGAKENTYTDGVICEKVARYAERLYHPNRLLKPQKRAGAKGDGEWQDVGWDDALDEIANEFIKAEQTHGSETVWPYFYAGTMGLVQRDSIHRLRHAKRYSGQYDTICVNMAFSGFHAGTGAMRGVDPREMAQSDCIVIWGTNAAATQVNVMTHAQKARRNRGAKLVVIDVYKNATMKSADLGLILNPGTDGALACAVLHILFRDGFADRAYMDRYTDDPAGLEAHLADKTPQWAAEITGLSVEQITEFTHLIGKTPRTYLRLGYGFTRSRNGAINMHAALSVAAVLGCWQHQGGGAFHSNADIYQLDQGEIKGLEHLDPDIRQLDQSRIGAILVGEEDALNGGPPVTALLVQNTNPACVAPEQRKVISGLKRDDLFVAVHEQFMTETAKLADIVLPATMFLEHDDIYRGGGHQHILLGPKQVDGPPLCRSNHFIIEELANRLGVGDQAGFGKTENHLIDQMLKSSGRGSLEEITNERWVDCQVPFEEAHYLNGFAHPDRKFHFRVDWSKVAWNRPHESMGLQGPVNDAPQFPDHWTVIEEATPRHPFRMTTSPARTFLNSTFNRTPGSLKREGRPEVL